MFNCPERPAVSIPTFGQRRKHRCKWLIGLKRLPDESADRRFRDEKQALSLFFAKPPRNYCVFSCPSIFRCLGQVAEWFRAAVLTKAPTGDFGRLAGIIAR